MKTTPWGDLRAEKGKVIGEELGGQVKACNEATGLTQADLAEHLGTTHSVITRPERRRREPVGTHVH
jgi:ribosome-binding protein aMBF1 (putative translation factor)